MLNMRKYRLVLSVCFVMIFVAVTGFFINEEHQSCMGIPVVSEETLEGYTESTMLDISQLTIDGQMTAADIASSTIYISQPLSVLSDFYKLHGKLWSKNPQQTLRFIDNDAMRDIEKAVVNGKPLSLAVISGKEYQRVNVVITTLPVMRLEGVVTHQDEEERDVSTGDLTLWTGFDPVTESYSMKTSKAEWHPRGNTAMEEEKHPWKISLKKDDGQNQNLEFLGLGEDDDWILNSLTMDDTKIKEKLFIDIWNEIAATTDYNFDMSIGEYVEVVINGNYCGLYLMQRRLDAKYLNLNSDDALLKVTVYEARNAYEAYKFVTDNPNKEEIYAIMQKVFEGSDCSNYNVENMIDVNIVLQLMNARDNFSLKNMYHVLKKSEDGFIHYLLPWDTDQSLGVVWKNGFAYDYWMATNDGIGYRMETGPLTREYPDYGERATKRWTELRAGLLTDDNILAHINGLYNSLVDSGAFARDTKLWGERYNGEDNIYSLMGFIKQRAALLDIHYVGWN